MSVRYRTTDPLAYYMLGISEGVALSGLIISIGVWNTWLALALVIICAACGLITLRVWAW